MAFKSDRQRKAVMARMKLKRGDIVINPTLISFGKGRFPAPPNTKLIVIKDKNSRILVRSPLSKERFFVKRIQIKKIKRR